MRPISRLFCRIFRRQVEPIILWATLAERERIRQLLLRCGLNVTLAMFDSLPDLAAALDRAFFVNDPARPDVTFTRGLRQGRFEEHAACLALVQHAPSLQAAVEALAARTPPERQRSAAN